MIASPRPYQVVHSPLRLLTCRFCGLHDQWSPCWCTTQCSRRWCRWNHAVSDDPVAYSLDFAKPAVPVFKQPEGAS